jgi:type IV secretion system protein VirB4
MATEGDRVRAYPLFVGMTRPAMVFGVTFGSFLVLGMASMLAFLWTGNFLAPVVIFVPGYLGCLHLCQRDPQIFEMIRAFESVRAGWLETWKRRDEFWGGKSYAPQPMPLSRRVRRSLQHGRRLRRKGSLDRRIPAAAHVDPYTVMNKDGSQQQAAVLEGYVAQTAAGMDLDARIQDLEAMLRELGPRYALYHHLIRRRVHPEAPGSFALGSLGSWLARRWQAQLDARPLFENVHYVTLVRRPARRARGLAALLSRRSDRRAAAQHAAAERRLLEEAMARVLSALAPYRPRRLQVIEDEQGRHSELLAFLAELIQCERREVRLTPLPLDQYLGYKRILFGREVLEISGAVRDDVKLGALLTIKEAAPHTSAGLFDGLQALPYELRIAQSACFLDREKVLRKLKLQRRQMRMAEDDARSLEAQLDGATDAVGSSHLGFVEHHWSVLVLARSAEELDAAVSDVTNELRAVRMMAARSDLTLEADYFAQIPGNFGVRGRRALISTANLACFLSLHGPRRGRVRDVWGPAVTVLETTAGTPFPFLFHGELDVENFTVLGPVGSGKTVVLNFLLGALQGLFRPPRLVLLDKDRGSEIFVRALGGRYFVLRPGEPTGFNLLAMPDTPQNRARIELVLQRILAPIDGKPLSAREAAVLHDAIAAFYESPTAGRRFADLEALLGGDQVASGSRESLAQRFRRWQEQYGWVFEGDEAPDTWAGPYLGIDLTRILGDARVREVILAYVFHRIDAWFDGYPTLLIAEEAWRYVDDPLCARYLEDLFKTLRKRNGAIGFCSQAAEDATGSSISDSIIQQSPTQIWLPNARATAAACCDAWKLTPEEFAWVQTLSHRSRCFLVKQGGESTVLRLDLSGMDDVLTVLSSREHTVRRLDALRAEVGDEPSAWLPRLLAEASGEVRDA